MHLKNLHHISYHAWFHVIAKSFSTLNAKIGKFLISPLLPYSILTLKKFSSIPTNINLQSVSETLHQLKGNVKFYCQRHTPDMKLWLSHHSYSGVFFAQQGKILAKSKQTIGLSVPALLIPTISHQERARRRKMLLPPCCRKPLKMCVAHKPRIIHVIDSWYRFEDIKSNKRKLSKSLSALI